MSSRVILNVHRHNIITKCNTIDESSTGACMKLGSAELNISSVITGGVFLSRSSGLH